MQQRFTAPRLTEAGRHFLDRKQKKIFAMLMDVQLNVVDIKV